MVEQNTIISECKFCHSGEKLVLATNRGFKVFQVTPTLELIYEQQIDGGIKHIQLLGTSDQEKAGQNVVFASTGENEMFPPYKVKFWNIVKSEGGSEINFKNDVKSLSGSSDL